VQVVIAGTFDCHQIPGKYLGYHYPLNTDFDLLMIEANSEHTSL
jgi:hypothetical protein